MIFPRERDVTVYLEHGRDLPDPHGLFADQHDPRQPRKLIVDPTSTAPTLKRFAEMFDLSLEPALRGHADRARRSG